jgi:hypothetical protein
MAFPGRREDARLQKGPELTRNGTLCLSKAILDSCCAPLSAESVYAEYFRPFTLVDEETNLSCLKSRPNQEVKIRNSMFHPRQPTEEPAFFNFNSHADINRLAQVIGKNIVIYFTNELWNFFEIYHDFRAFNNNLVSVTFENEHNGDSEDGEEEENSSQKPLTSSQKKWRTMRNRNRAEKIGVFYVLTASRKLYKFDTCLDHLLTCPFFTSEFWRMRVNFFEDDYGVLLSMVLHVQPPPFPISSICELTFRLRDLWTLWKRRVILVNFCRLNFNQKNAEKVVARRQNPKYSNFFNLGVIAPQPHENEEPSVGSLHLEDFESCVCFFGNTFACELKDVYRKEVIAQYKSTSRRDKPASSNFARIPKVSLEEQRKALAIELRKKQLKRKFPSFQNDPNEASSSKKGRVCSCSKCSSEDYNLNMNLRGPERLCTYTLDIAELLYFLGADTPENLAIVEKLSELSVASMDIESMTVQVHLEPPVQQIGGINYGTIDQASLEGHFKKVQKPIMIAHTDKLTMEDDMVKDDVVVFTAASDAEEDLYAMMRAYWTHVKHQQNSSKNVKKLIAQPLLEMIRSYKLTHFDVYNSWCERNQIEPEPKLITRAWYQTLVGQLEKKLLKLITDYNIFSFYG